MVLIAVGGGSAQAVVEVDRVPEVGDQITIARDEQIKGCRTDNAYALVGDTFVVTAKRGPIEFEGEMIPQFDLCNSKFIPPRFSRRNTKS